MPGTFIYSRAELPEARAYAANGIVPQRLYTNHQISNFIEKWQNFREVNGKFYIGQRELIFSEDVDAFLAAYWKNPKKAAAFTGRDKLFPTIKADYVGVSKAKIMDFLAKQPGHRIHLAQHKPRVVNPIVSNNPFEAVQLDQSVFRDKYLLCAVDLYSKYAWVSLHQSACTAQDTVALCYEVLNSAAAANRTWKVLQSDNGGEFVNEAVERFCQTYNIKHLRSLPYKSTSQGAVERFHRTLKLNIAKRLTILGGRITKAAVDDAVKSYNESVHTVAEEKPADILAGTARNHGRKQVKAVPDNIRPRIKKGDYVRLSVYTIKENRKTGLKGDARQWSLEVYKVVSKSKNRNPLSQHTYTLRDQNRNIVGKFYRYQLQLTTKDGAVLAAAADEPDEPETKSEPKEEPTNSDTEPPKRARATGPGGGRRQLAKEMRDLTATAGEQPTRSKRAVKPTEKAAAAGLKLRK